ncbi:AAA family ATPase [Paenibacillus aceti]|uniref:Tunicamycin resistance protein n=1 Tax=Paenibacillus aceti TaxID=1820010 RepID=A0ABQ1VSE6_9BACL|nr:AAA family ATPase [Paenibacillus aceti]GGF94553.1 tunicamycin resistance protein [Paenibacillus aceti]
MILWINGAFGSGKTTTAYELQGRILNSIVYDPENTGFFIRKQLPKSIHLADFQDYPMWRQINYMMLKHLSEEYDGTVIVPMTITDFSYFAEIVGRLRGEGIEVKHVTLLASRETLFKRLRSRGERADSWPIQQIDRCLASLSEPTFAEQIQTDNMHVDEVVERIASICGITLPPDTRSRFRRSLDRKLITIKHIRL